MARVLLIGFFLMMLIIGMTMSESDADGAEGNDGVDAAGGNDGADAAGGNGGADGADGNGGAAGADGNDGTDGADGNDGTDGDDSDGSSGGRRRRRNKGKDEVFTWQQNVGAGSPVTKSAQVLANKGVIIIKSKDDDLDNLGFEQSTTTYDYSTGTSVVAIQPKGRGPCFLLEESLSYSEILDGVRQLSGTVAAKSPEISLDGTGTPLTNEDANLIFKANPEIKQTCGRGNVIVLAEPGDLPPSEGETKEIKVLTYDAELTIVAPAGRRAAAVKRFRSRVTLRNRSSYNGNQTNVIGSSQRRFSRVDEKADSRRFSWQQDLGSDRSAEKSVIVQGDDLIVTVESLDVNLSKFGFNASITTYDFTRGSGVVVMRKRVRGACYLTDEALSYRDIVDGAAQLNGTLAGRTAQVTLDGTNQSLSRTERNALFRSNPALRLPCRLRTIIPAVEPGALPSYNGTTTELKFLTFDGEITIITRSTGTD
ncbi:hypothetical protein RRG08_030828 [Elysia crispata]|uniref:Uncharacterized protein n=1 Tax=Elysia crispata TaxID=231223 RepID=A0AAE1AAY2_9GAST|nr:hypothetical protein RRG08_030828 [Elysia crispata]